MDNTITDSDGITLYDQFKEMASSQTDRPSPKEVSDAFFKMVEEVQKMDRETIESLSNEEILELGAPIRLATEGTIKLSEKTLQQLREPLGKLTNRFHTMTREKHRALSSEIDKIIASDGDGGHERRSLTADQIRDLLMELSGETMFLSSTTCEQMFTMQGDRVILMPGDSFNTANSICPAGTLYYITGTHYGQSVSSSKTGNSWVGGSSAVMDGQNTISSAFNSGMTGNSISWIEIRKYTEWGLKSQSSSSTNIEIKNMIFKNIGANKSGEEDFGAIHFDYTENVLVQYSYFNNVSHSIRFRFSDGPLQVLNNEVLNTGFGFFQCNQCEGSNIKINNNSLEHTNKYGVEELHDFINIFNSVGSSSNFIQVINNRARVNLFSGNASGVSEWGCAVLLGDDGGSNQEAKNNIGVNPGACGIGLASGSNMYVSDNKMYSAAVPGISNVGYYSINFYSPKTCSNHQYVNQSNSADWTCGNPANCTPPYNNPADANGSCTDQNNSAITRLSLTNLIKDEALGAGIWNNW